MRLLKRAKGERKWKSSETAHDLDVDLRGSAPQNEGAGTVKCVSLARIAQMLVETYLGRDPGRRVLDGLIRRSVADRISAVPWCSDLREFTRVTDLGLPWRSSIGSSGSNA